MKRLANVFLAHAGHTRATHLARVQKEYRASAWCGNTATGRAESYLASQSK